MNSTLKSAISIAKGRKFAVGAAIASIAAIAFAANWGPFLMKVRFPNINYADDAEAYFVYSQQLPRAYLNYKVQDINKGDRVRIVYPNGAVWDFETTARCSYVSSVSCSFSNPVRVASSTAPTQPTNYDIAYWRADTCPWDSGYKDIPTGYWASKTVQTGENEFTQNAWYVSTGTKSVYIKGAGCK